MVTQGLLSIVVRGHVKAKVITGADGWRVRELAKSLRQYLELDLEPLMERAREVGLGGGSLIIMTAPDRYMRDEDDGEPLPPLYAQTFNDPHFNPRWERGTAAYTEVIRIFPPPPRPAGLDKTLPRLWATLQETQARLRDMEELVQANRALPSEHVDTLQRLVQRLYGEVSDYNVAVQERARQAKAKDAT